MDDATRHLLERLLARVTELEAQVAQQAQQIAGLAAENQRLHAENRRLQDQLDQAQRAAARQAAPFRRPEAKRVPAGQKRRPGRPPGHPGACRPVPGRIDEWVEAPLAGCPRCGGAVTAVTPVVQYVEDLPPAPPRPWVTRVTTYRGQCARCGAVSSRHPRQMGHGHRASGVHLGPRFLAAAIHLVDGLGLPLRKACAALGTLTGLTLTPGGLAQALGRSADRLAVEYDALVTAVRSGPAVYVDETSWWVGGPGHWLWVFTTPQATVYHVDEGRGSAVVLDVLGTNFAGVLVSDCLNSYDPPPFRKHKCIAHHLRAIAQARDRPDTPDPRYLDEWKLFFTAVRVIAARRGDLPASEYAARCHHLEAWCDRLLATAVAQPGDVAVRNRLGKQRAHLLGCLSDPSVEPTNNRAERALRPAVVKRKVSCGNKTAAGSQCWMVLTSLVETCRQQAVNVLDWFAARLPLPAEPVPAG